MRNSSSIQPRPSLNIENLFSLAKTFFFIKIQIGETGFHFKKTKHIITTKSKEDAFRAVDEYKIRSRQEYVLNDNRSMYKELKLALTFLGTHQINISVKMAPGCVSIKGSNFQKWINTEFNLVKKFIEIGH